MDKPTVDPYIVIEDSGVNWVRYRDTTNGQRWQIDGVCSCCGACEEGNTSPHLDWRGPVGMPGACVDRRGMNRPDVPIRPELPLVYPTCSLWGTYL